METNATAERVDEEKKSRLLLLLKKTSPAGVLTFRNSKHVDDFLDRTRVYYQYLTDMGYTFTVFREDKDEVVLHYREGKPNA